MREPLRVDLRVERERRGLSLDQVSDRARIPRSYLDALETGQADAVQRGPFLQSYRRQYLAFLGLPTSAQVQPSHPAPVAPAADAAAPTQHPSTGQSPPRPSPPLTDALVDEPTLDAGDRAERSRPVAPEDAVTVGDFGQTRTITRQYDNVPVVRLVLAGFLVTMALLLGMKLLSGLVDRASESSAVAAAAGLAAPAVVEAEAVQTPADAAAPPTDPPEDPPATAVTTPVMRVHLRAHERVRVSVTLDGTTAYAGWLEAGQQHDFHGADEIAIDVSDLTRLTMAYNGQKVEPLGNLSHPRRLVFEHDGG